MTWQKLELEADRRTAGALSDVLLDHGALSVSVMDAAAGTAGEQPVYDEPGEADQPGDANHWWDRCTLSALFPLEADVEAALAAASGTAGLAAPPPFRLERLADQDWVRRTQELLQPVRASRRIWIVHTWHAPVAAEPSGVRPISIVIDPGLAFGTGGHATTRLCVAWLDEHVRGGETILDYGTGSGILAIAALKLGAARAVGVDVDADALRVAAENAAINGVRLELRAAAPAPPVQADLVVANILANPLKALAPLLAAATRPRGRLALSGVLADQAEEVTAAYRGAFEMEPPVEEEGWVLLSGRRVGG